MFRAFYMGTAGILDFFEYTDIIDFVSANTSCWPNKRMSAKDSASCGVFRFLS